VVGERLAQLVVPHHHLRAEAHHHQQRGIVVGAERLVAEVQLADTGELLLRDRRHRSRPLMAFMCAPFVRFGSGFRR
jgi:hypothetical protein